MWKTLNQHLRNRTLLTAARNKAIKALSFRRSSKIGIGNSYYGERAATYLEKRLSQPSWHAEQEAMRRLLLRLPDGISVLDVPFGTGRFVPYYIEKEMSISGLDASSDMLLAAKKQLGDRYSLCNLRIGDARRLPYHENSFDVVVSFRFLQTMIEADETPQVLRELQRVTRAYAILELKVRKDGIPRPHRKKNQPMTFQLCEREIRALLSDVGFIIRDIEVIGPPDSKYKDLALKYAYFCEKK